MHKMKLHRFLKEMSLDELEAQTGIDRSKLSRIERGYVQPKTNEKKLIAKALNCNITTLFSIGVTDDNHLRGEGGDEPSYINPNKERRCKM